MMWSLVWIWCLIYALFSVFGWPDWDDQQKKCLISGSNRFCVHKHIILCIMNLMRLYFFLWNFRRFLFFFSLAPFFMLFRSVTSLCFFLLLKTVCIRVGIGSFNSYICYPSPLLTTAELSHTNSRLLVIELTTHSADCPSKARTFALRIFLYFRHSAWIYFLSFQMFKMTVVVGGVVFLLNLWFEFCIVFE